MYQSLIGAARKTKDIFASHIHYSKQQEAKSNEDLQSFKLSLKQRISDESQQEDKLKNNVQSFESQRSRAKTAILNYIKNVLKLSSLSQEIYSEIQSLDKVLSFEQLLDSILLLMTNIFEIEKNKYLYNYIHAEKAKPAENELLINVRSKQTKILRLVREENPKHEKKNKSQSKYQEIVKDNDGLKKEVFQLKEEKQSLEKKMLELIEEYRNRKGFYLAEIKKLTQIINMSSFDVRNLVLERTKQAKMLQKNNGPQRVNQAQHIEAYPDKETPYLKVNYHQKHQLMESSRVSRVSRNGYNTEVKMLKGVGSIQNLQEGPYDSNRMIY